MKIRNLLLGSIAMAGLTSSSPYSDLGALSYFDPFDFISVRGLGGTGGRSYRRSPGSRAHKRWKRARASGLR